LIYEEATWQDVRGSCSDQLKQFCELHKEKYVPHARSRISQLQKSALQLLVAKPFAEIRSKFVPSLSWSGVFKKKCHIERVKPI
jgi:hypothetical protein